MFKCCRCGEVFVSPHNRYNQPVDEYDEDAACPNCYSHDFEPVADCVECGAIKEPDELVNGMCEDCINLAASDLCTVINYAGEHKRPAVINGLLEWAFSTSEIEEILLRELLNSGKAREYAAKYATDDTDVFTEWLNERRNEE